MTKHDEIICRKLGRAVAALEAIAEECLPLDMTPSEYARIALEKMEGIEKTIHEDEI